VKRVLIIGNAGSGKTTFARQLAAKTGLPLVHLDQLYWHGNWEHLSQGELDARLQEELVRPEWIIDGNYNRTLAHRLNYCDTVLFFDMPILSCLVGITKRIIANYGKTREDMGGNCVEKFDRQKVSLYRNVIQFNKQHRKAYYKLLADATHAEVVVFKRRRQAKRFLEHVASQG